MRIQFIAGIIISLIYWVGFVSLATHNMGVLKLTPINMLLSLVVLNIGYKADSKLFLLQVGVFVLGFTIELLGVKTQIVFGSYAYLDNLGFKICETPLVMGINWCLTVFCCSSMSSFFLKEKSVLAQALLGSILMVLMDLFIEPICERTGFWVWANGEAPIRNYLAWFVIGFIIQYVVFKSKIVLNNFLSFLLYALQIIFFILAYIYL